MGDPEEPGIGNKVEGEGKDDCRCVKLSQKRREEVLDGTMEIGIGSTGLGTDVVWFARKLARKEEGRQTGWANKLGVFSLSFSSHQLALVALLRGKWKMYDEKGHFRLPQLGPLSPAPWSPGPLVVCNSPSNYLAPLRWIPT